MRGRDLRSATIGLGVTHRHLLDSLRGFGAGGSNSRGEYHPPATPMSGWDDPHSTLGLP